MHVHQHPMSYQMSRLSLQVLTVPHHCWAMNKPGLSLIQAQSLDRESHSWLLYTKLPVICRRQINLRGHVFYTCCSWGPLSSRLASFAGVYSSVTNESHVNGAIVCKLEEEKNRCRTLQLQQWAGLVCQCFTQTARPTIYFPITLCQQQHWSH